MPVGLKRDCGIVIFMGQHSSICFVELAADHVCHDGAAREVGVSFACDASSAAGFRSSLEIRVAPPLESQNGSVGSWVGETMSEALARFGIFLPSEAGSKAQGLVKCTVTDHSAILDTERELFFPLCCEFAWDGETVLDARVISPDPRIIWQNGSKCIPSGMLPCELSMQSLNSIMSLFGEELELPSETAAIPWEFPSLSPGTVKPSSVVVEPAIQRNPRILHGAPSFPCSRVFVSSLLTSLMSGETVDDFVKMFPSVKRERAVAALAAIADETLTAGRTN